MWGACCGSDFPQPLTLAHAPPSPLLPGPSLAHFSERADVCVEDFGALLVIHLLQHLVKHAHNAKRKDLRPREGREGGVKDKQKGGGILCAFLRATLQNPGLVGLAGEALTSLY
jgi:hypothetical protein